MTAEIAFKRALPDQAQRSLVARGKTFAGLDVSGLGRALSAQGCPQSERYSRMDWNGL
jgi:hypothetical protein